MAPGHSDGFKPKTWEWQVLENLLPSREAGPGPPVRGAPEYSEGGQPARPWGSWGGRGAMVQEREVLSKASPPQDSASLTY